MDALSPVICGLPHREPFLFVDAVLDREPGQRAKVIRTFRAEEGFFAGHFPDEPLVPGVLLVEAIAQCAGIAAGAPSSGGTWRLTAIRQAKFFMPVRPGDTTEILVEMEGGLGGLVRAKGEVRRGGELVAEAAVVLSSG